MRTESCLVAPRALWVSLGRGFCLVAFAGFIFEAKPQIAFHAAAIARSCAFRATRRSDVI